MLSCTDDQINTIIQEENNYTTDKPLTSVPIPGNNGLLLTSNITENSVKMQWTFANDDSPSELLQYQVIVSQTLTLFSLQEILQSGLLKEDNWSNQPINQSTITNLSIGKLYHANVCVRDPDKNIAVYTPTSFTTKGRMYLFSAGTYTGDMIFQKASRVVVIVSARDALNALCKSVLQSAYPDLPQDNVIAFISINNDDSIATIPLHFAGIPLDWPVYSPSGIIIAYNWDDLVDSSINKKLQDAGVCDSFWWSGSLADGTCDALNTCNGWTDGTNSFQGRSGAHNKTEQWLSDNERNCNNQHHLLGLCW
ncbi:MAG TPA: hypothetical protein PLH80_04730 [Spirochaetota bacterium]|nr:hypothetical protein [Spirochaetota bacterium]HQG41498.1 hypothetical protein [Spirochaetota bacterium]HQI37845.1 hypothetical protein [Spirochaetota bacterium]HRV15010.1 hypothetical protein [Spirochaetota bacterium]